MPQRRRRVFVVGYSGDWRPAVAVLLEPEGMCRHPSPRRQTRTQVARALTGSTGGCSAKEQQHTFIDVDGRPLNALCYGGGNTSGRIDVATCLTRHGARQDFDTETFAVVKSPCSGPKVRGREPVEAGHIVTHALTSSGGSEDGTGRGVPLVPHEYPLAFQPRIGRSGRGRPSEIVPALAGASAGATSDSRPCVATRYAVRRLTPRECERLQGFPDDYTLIQFRGKPAADGPRYRALGNSMAVPVMSWIGRRIDVVDGLVRHKSAPAC